MDTDNIFSRNNVNFADTYNYNSNKPIFLSRHEVNVENLRETSANDKAPDTIRDESSNSSISKPLAVTGILASAAAAAYTGYSYLNNKNKASDSIDKDKQLNLEKLLPNGNLFISNNLKLFLNKCLLQFKNNNHSFISNIDFILYKELLLFIKIVKTFDIINIKQIFTKDMISIFCSSDSLDIKKNKFLEYTKTIDIFSFDNIIDCIEIFTSYFKGTNTTIQYNNNKSEIIKTINKCFLKINTKLFDFIKNKLKTNKEDNKLFFELFDNVEFDKNTYTNTPTIIKEMSKTSISC